MSPCHSLKVGHRGSFLTRFQEICFSFQKGKYDQEAGFKLEHLDVSYEVLVLLLFHFWSLGN